MSGSRVKLIRSQTRNILKEQEHFLLVKSFEKLMRQRLRKRLVNALRIVFKVMPKEVPLRLRIGKKLKLIAEKVRIAWHKVLNFVVKLMGGDL